MRRAVAAVATALLLSACAFSSERALFEESEAVTPIPDGARFYWRENGGSETGQQILYRRVGGAYELAPAEGSDPPVRVLLIDVPETPEEDYIAQAALFVGEEARAYAFMWRVGESYRLVAAPRVVEGEQRGEAALARHCADRVNTECRFNRAEDVRAFYREAIYPAFVVSGTTPSDYIDQVPVERSREAK